MRGLIMFVPYGVLALPGGAGTYFNIQSAPAGEQYLAGWFATWLASALVPLSVMIAISFNSPLFLASRRWHVGRVMIPANAAWTA